VQRSTLGYGQRRGVTGTRGAQWDIGINNMKEEVKENVTEFYFNGRGEDK
jgi:hypothetical protein